jgi:putative tricarboxylic transport membrane protein
MRVFCKSRVLIAVTLLISLGAVAAYGASVFPEKPITLIVHGKAGDGADVLARLIAAAVEKHKLLPQPIVVENKPGGSAAIAMAYVAGKMKDPYFLGTESRLFITTPLQGKSPVTLANFTPICNFDFDDHLLMVGAKSKYKSIMEIVAAAKANPGKITIGGGFAGGTESLNSRLIEKAAGAQISYMSFNSGSDALVALLGGHIDMSSANTSEAYELEKAKKIRFLGILTEKRLPQAPEIPTIKEQGLNVVGLGMNRGIMAPAGIPEDARRIIEGALFKFSKTDMYKKYVEDNMISPTWMDGPTFAKWLDADKVRTAAVMEDMGLLKKK